MIAMAGAWFLKNPLVGGLGVIALLLGIGLGVQTVRLTWSDAALVKEQLAFSNFKTDLAVKSFAVVQAAAKKSAEQVEALTSEVKNIGLVAAQAKTEVRYVQSNNGPCVKDPVYGATIGGVQRTLDAKGNPGGDQGKTGSGPTPVVRGAGAPGPGQKP